MTFGIEYVHRVYCVSVSFVTIGAVKAIFYSATKSIPIYTFTHLLFDFDAIL